MSQPILSTPADAWAAIPDGEPGECAFCWTLQPKPALANMHHYDRGLDYGPTGFLQCRDVMACVNRSYGSAVSAETDQRGSA